MKKETYIHTFEDIIKIKFLHKERLEFETLDCCYYIQYGICCSSGVRSISIVRQFHGVSRLDANVSILQKDLTPQLNACKKSLTKENKNKLANRALSLFNTYYDPENFSTSAPSLLKERKEKEDSSKSFLDFMPTVKIGSKTIDPKVFKNLL